MRLIYPCLLLGIVGGAGIVGILGASSRAAALSCLIEEPPWQDPDASPLQSSRSHPHEYEPDVLVPVDARLWQMVSCGPNQPAVTGTCELVDEDGVTRVAVEAEHIGAEFCERPLGARQDETHAYYLRRFTPPQPLTPGRGYSIECQDPRAYAGAFRVRESEAPAAPAPAIELTSAYVTRGDDGGCCGDTGDLLELRLADMSPAFLDEGGYIEAVLPGGQHLVFVRPEGDRFILPATREVIELTAVSASGARGETLVLDAGEVDGDLVYIPCNVTDRRPTAALWLLMPLAWIYAQGRRRRRSV